MTIAPVAAEKVRLDEDASRAKNWKRWGPYLSERQWGTVREDYSADGSCWDYFPHDHARSRAYRWGEDGLLGICDREGRLCFALALWNGKDPILKERLFGLTGTRGEPRRGRQGAVLLPRLHADPLVHEGALQVSAGGVPLRAARRGEPRGAARATPELELIDTGVFDENRYFDVFAEYAKASPNDILIRITVANRGPEAATVHVLPQLWFRNTWSWGRTTEGYEAKPSISRGGDSAAPRRARDAGPFPPGRGARPRTAPLPGFSSPRTRRTPRASSGRQTRARTSRTPSTSTSSTAGPTRSTPPRSGTKAAAHYVLEIPAGGKAVGAPASLRGGRGAEAALRPRLPMGLRAAPARGRRLLRQPHPGGLRGGAPRRPAGLRRPSLVEAVLLLRREGLARRRPGAAGPAGKPPRGAKRRLGTHPQPRRHLDARQVGVPLVRGLGPGLPHDPAAPRSIRTSPRSSSSSSRASGTCTRTASFRPTSSPSAT